MSEELTGQASVEAGQGYVPMPDTHTEAPSDFNGDAGGLHEAATELTERRRREREDSPIVTREYQDERTGEPLVWSPETAKATGEKLQTITIDRAARDLAELRQSEAIEPEAREEFDFAATIDAHRAQEFGQPPPLQPGEHNETHTADPAAIEALTPQPETTEGAPSDGASEKIARAMQDPEIAAAWQAEYGKVQAAEAAYQQAARQNALMAAAVVSARIPEFNGVAPEQQAAVLRGIASSNPQRAQQIISDLQQVAILNGEVQKAEQRQQQAFESQFQQWAKSHDDAFSDAAAKIVSPEALKEISAEVISMAQDYGIDRKTLAYLYNTQPLMRAAPFQMMLMNAARLRLAEKATAKSPRKPLPPVIRPGVREPAAANDGYGVTAAGKAFAAKPDAKTAARLVAARRRAADAR